MDYKRERGGVIVWLAACILIWMLLTLFQKMRERQGDPDAICVWGRWKAIYAFLRNTSYLWLICAGVIFICWIPYLLGGWPGFYAEDAGSQVPQVLYDSVGYSAWQPLFHTLLMGYIIKAGYLLAGELSVGVTMYCVFQMTVCALLFGYFAQWMRNLSHKLAPAVLAVCFYGFLPTIAMYVICTTKDVLCYSLCVLVLLFLYRMFGEEDKFFRDKRHMIAFGCSSVLVCLLRNNMVYVFFAFGLITVFVRGKRRFGRFLLFVAIVAASVGVNKFLMESLHAEPGSAREMLSVPFQQLARVYCYKGEDAFSEEELQFFFCTIEPGALGGYNPFLADPVKDRENYAEISRHKLQYVELWLKKGIAYPEIYIDAFAENTYQAWYPGTCITDEPGKVSSYFDFTNDWTYIKRMPVLRKVCDFCEKIAEGFYYQRIPIVRLLFSIGFMVWAMLFVFSCGMLVGDRGVIAVIVFMGLTMFTLLLGPGVYVRYYLYLFFAFPVMITFLTLSAPDAV